MPKISKLLTGDEKSLHLFSNDLVWGCRYHAMQASQSQHTYSTFTANLSCVLFAGSFLEAKLNERSTRPAVAPSAMRIPTSRVRRAVSYETSAYVPISTSANARPEKHESRKLRNRTRAVGFGQCVFTHAESPNHHLTGYDCQRRVTHRIAERRWIPKCADERKPVLSVS